MSTSRHSNASAGPSKRQKVYRACLGCVNSKTRCEDVLPRDGCLRCRSKGVSCSLIESVNGDERGESNDDEMRSRLDSMEEGWRSLDVKLDRLEQYIHSIPSAPTSSSANNLPTPGRIPVHTPIPRPVDIHALFTTLHWHSIAVTERVFTVSSDLGYPDPVLRGLVTLDQMEMAFHLFKHRFSSLVPLAPYLLSSTSPPTHPFVRAAFLAHVSPSSELWALIEESVLTVNAGAVGNDIPLALLVLSLAPNPNDRTRAPMTALRMIAMAYSVGQNLGWDVMCEVWSRSPLLTEPEWCGQLDQILLWESIKNRYNILAMMQGMTSLLAPSMVHQLPPSSSAQHCQSIVYLQDEANMIAAFTPILRRICTGEVVSFTGLPDVDGLVEAWPTIVEACDRWKQTRAMAHNLPTYDAQLLLFALAFRFSCVIQRVPSPIACGPRISAQGFTGLYLLRYSATLLEIYNSIPDSEVTRLPAYLHCQVVVSVSVLQRAFSHMRTQGGDWFKDQEHSVHETVRRIRDDMGGVAAEMLAMTDEHHVPGQPTQELDFEALFGGLPDGWLQAFSIGGDWTAGGGVSGGLGVMM